MLGGFLNLCHFSVLSQSFSLTLELTDLTVVSGQQAPPIFCLCLPSTGITDVAMPGFFNVDSRDSNLDLHACEETLFGVSHAPRPSSELLSR